MLGIVGWLAGTKAGRFVAAAIAIVTIAGIALLKAFGAGKRAERARQDRASLDNLRTRNEVEDETQRMSGDDRRRRLGEWVRDPER